MRHAWKWINKTALTIGLISVFSNVDSITAQAAMAAEIQLDNGTVRITTRDKKATSGVRWRTYGYTIHPIDHNTFDQKDPDIDSYLYKTKSRNDKNKTGIADRTEGNFFYFGFPNEAMGAGTTNGGEVITTHEFDITKMEQQRSDRMDEFASSAEWKEEWLNRWKNLDEAKKEKKPFAVELNGITTMFKAGNPPIYYGFFEGIDPEHGHDHEDFRGTLCTLEPGWIDGTSDNFRIPNDDGASSQSPTWLQSAAPWGRRTIEDIGTKYLIREKLPFSLTGDPEDPNNPGTPDDPNGPDLPKPPIVETGMSGLSFPLMSTYNFSHIYKLGEGIPSGEKLTNGFLANRWFGVYKWGRTGNVVKNYTIHCTAEGEQKVIWYEYYTNSKGKTRRRRHVSWEPWEKDFTFQTDRQGYYYVLESANFGEFKSARVNNDAYGVVNYTGSFGTLPFTLVANGENNPSTISYDYSNENHIHFSEESGDVSDHVDVGRKFGSRIPTVAQIMHYTNLQTKWDNTEQLTVTTNNDSLIIDNKTYMNNAPVSSHTRGASPTMIRPQVIVYGEPKVGNPKSGGDFCSISQTKEVLIPSGRKNGSYETSYQATYGILAPSNSPDAMYDDRNKPAITKEHLVDDEGRNQYLPDNEELVVHTPVISPVRITNPEKQTQLIQTPAKHYKANGVDGDVNLLWLDGTYHMQFDEGQWRQNFRDELRELDGYESDRHENGRYDEYVAKKKVRFPFDVFIKNEEFREVLHRVKTGDGYTDWINVPKDGFDFYIPTWAKETTTKNKGNGGSPYDIQFRVEAVNMDESNESSTETEQNTHLENHVATYDVFANVSGRVYGFQIVGVNDRDMFHGYDEDVTKSWDYSFVKNKEEKKSGDQNRFGKYLSGRKPNDNPKVVRYTLDGRIQNPWNTRNTLPLRSGSSQAYSDMGILWKGSKISFTMKTIANLSESNDRVEIQPTFRYMERGSDGKMHIGSPDDIRIYYCDDAGNYIKYGSSEDLANRKTVQLGTEPFEGTLYEDPNYSSIPVSNLAYTARMNGVSEGRIKNAKNPSYTLSTITLDKNLRLVSGDHEELERNLGKWRAHPSITDPNDPNHASSTGYTNDIGNIPEIQDDFRKSMQTWYGQYLIPERIYVAKRAIKVDGKAVLLDAVKGQKGYDKDADLNHDGLIDLQDVALDLNLSRDSDIWQKDGYLILHFDIKTVNGGHDHLRYGGNPVNVNYLRDKKGNQVRFYEGGVNPSGTENMWDRDHENQITHAKIDTQYVGERQPVSADNPDGNPLVERKEVNLEYGDIALIDLRYGLTSKLSANIFMIN